jgi:hypothetical protein
MTECVVATQFPETSIVTVASLWFIGALRDRPVDDDYFAGIDRSGDALACAGDRLGSAQDRESGMGTLSAAVKVDHAGRQDQWQSQS